MIRILKHGHAQYEITCKFCECVFTFEDSDIKNNGCQWDLLEWITCPECHQDNEIYDKNHIKHHPYD